MDRIHKGLTGPVFVIEPVQVVAANLKGGNAPNRVFNPDPAQITAFAQEECPDENIRGLVMLGDRFSPPFARQD